MLAQAPTQIVRFKQPFQQQTYIYMTVSSIERGQLVILLRKHFAQAEGLRQLEHGRVLWPMADSSVILGNF